MRRSARLVALWLVLAGCRSEVLPPPDLQPAPHDLAAADRSVPDLARVDLSSVDGDPICAPDQPMGYCPDGYTCCPFTCWGSGPAPYVWCFHGMGCPVC